MKSNLKFLSFLSLLLISTSALYVYVEKDDPFCFLLDPITPSHYNLYYESLAKTSSLAVTLTSTSLPGMVLEGRSNSTVINATSQVTVCMHTGNPEQPVSIDFYSSQQKDIKHLALKSHVYQIHEQYMKVGNKLKQLSHHEQFEEQRQAIQSQIIANQEKTIFFYSTIKVVLVIAVISVQIFMLLRGLGGDGVKRFLNL